MNRRLKFFFHLGFIFIYFFTPVHSKLQSEFFKSNYAPNNFEFPKNLVAFKTMFFESLKTLDEEALIMTSLNLGGPMLGLQTHQVEQLTSDLKKIYKEIKRDSEFKTLKGVLPYCIDHPSGQGHYFLYTPTQKSDKTILFIHGYGGNPLFYLYLLKKHFPNHNIICPTSGISWDRQSNYYLNEVLKHVAQKGIVVDRFTLLSLSQGGPAGFKYLKEYPSKVSLHIPIVSTPLKSQLNTIPKGSHIFMINGEQDKRISYKFVKAVYSYLSRHKSIHFSYKAFDGDHFILLSREKEIFAEIKKAMDNVHGL